MGFDMTEGTIAAWLKQEGETVTKGEPIAEIETDKTTIQIEAFQSGVLLKQLAQPGQKVPVGEPIGLIGDVGEKAPAASAPAASAPAASAPAAAVTPAAPAETPRQTEDDRATAQASGANPATTDAPSANSSAAVAAPPVAAPAASNGNSRIIATPIAKRIAEERGIDLRAVSGTGPEGCITKSDVESFKGAPAAPVATPTPSATPQPAQPAVVQVVTQPPVPAAADAQISAIAKAAASGGGTRQPLTRMRQTIAKRMVESKTQVPHFYITVTAEMDATMSLRQQINESLKAEGAGSAPVKISVNDMVVRAVALALRKYPAMNSSFAGDAVEPHPNVHVGNAVTVTGGLVTVTVRDTDTKSLRQISQEMTGLAQRARDGKSQPGEMGGQTFTISNLGMYGVDEFIAIVNQPDAGILAVASATPTPVVRDGQVVIRNIMKMTISGDHRVVDGAIGAEFINEIKRLLESPWNLVL